MLHKRLTTEDALQSNDLRMSNFGTKCDRKLWYSVNMPEAAEPLLPYVRMRFLYGDIIEEVVLSLAAEAGHSVEGQQDELELFGVKGHRDAIIDGVLVDVKSANSRSFAKFKKPFEEIKDDIWFSSYVDQLQMYLEASQPELTVKGVGAFLAIDKEMGHMTLQMVRKEQIDWKEKIETKRKIVQEAKPPKREFSDEKDGESGNRKLPTYCSYCQYKNTCWKGLRTFVSSAGPKHLTVVAREPNLLEIK